MADFEDDFRRFFLRGLGALVPTVLTIAILVWGYAVINDYIGVHVTKGILVLCSWRSDAPAPGLVNEDRDPLKYGAPLNEWDDHGQRLTIEHKIIHHRVLQKKSDPGFAQALSARNQALWQIAFMKYRLHLLGFLIAILLVYFMGFFLASFLGKTIWRACERLLNRIPLIRAIYPHVKQVTDFLLSERKSFDLSSVVAVQYPRKGLWSLGLSTGGPLDQVQKADTEELVSVFIPSSPTPITGYVIQVPRKDVIELSLTIDEALRFTVSGGVIKPGVPLLGDDESD